MSLRANGDVRKGKAIKKKNLEYKKMRDVKKRKIMQHHIDVLLKRRVKRRKIISDV